MAFSFPITRRKSAGGWLFGEEAVKMHGLWLGASVLALAWSGVAAAQTTSTPPAQGASGSESGSTLREVVVTAERRTQNLQQTAIAATGGALAPWMTSVTFGGADLRTVYLGSLKGTSLPCFRSPVAGLPMVHWSER